MYLIKRLTVPLVKSLYYVNLKNRLLQYLYLRLFFFCFFLAKWDINHIKHQIKITSRRKTSMECKDSCLKMKYNLQVFYISHRPNSNSSIHLLLFNVQREVWLIGLKVRDFTSYCDQNVVTQIRH